MPKIAAIQMCSSPSVEDNLTTASRLIEQAAQQGAAVAALPEMFVMMGAKEDQQSQIAEVYGQGVIQETIAKFAAEQNIWVIAGTIPIRRPGSQKISAACLVYDNNGACVCRYDKIHLFDTVLSADESYQESDTVTAGHQAAVVESPVGKIGLAVCYDLRFPGLFNHLSNLGAEIMVVPSAFTFQTGQDHWQLLTRCRAIDNLAYLVAPNQGGHHAGGRKTYGHTLIVEPWGHIISSAGASGEAIVVADIDVTRLHQIRKTLPILQHQRIKPDLSQL